ncbi:glutamate/gamma-aminobutyrate family transporter YjeM [Alicyclobacillaceae bacterium I2511]|nr:glutamate/gamma-aminobutyrate family transporter YjeM [Alicyclobacillaceae bacterium I2511]
MGANENARKKLTLIPVILMIFTSVFGFTNMPRAFYLMGYSAIPWYVVSGITFFILYAFMMVEYGAAFKKEKGGIYSWMEKSVGPRYAFIGTFMWYASNVIWMVTISSTIWIPLSNALFGSDTTSTWSLFGMGATKTLGLLGVLWMLVVTYIATLGIKQISKVASVGGIAVALLNVVLLVGAVTVLIANGGHLATPVLSAHAFFQSPNPSYQIPIGMLSFVVFAIFAYGGLEVVGGLVDQTEHAERTMPKAIIISAAIIAVAYSLGIFLVGIFTNWHAIMDSSKVNLANVAYVVMQNLGYQIGLGFGLGQSTSLIIGAWVARLMGLSMFLALIGAFATLGYAPLKQLIEGTPAELWPGNVGKITDGVPKTALWIQGFLVAVMIFLMSFGGEGVSKFFTYLILMTNVAMTIPYMFLSGAFVPFKKKSEIIKPVQMFKSMKSVWIAAIAVTFTVGFANLFTIIQPALTGDLTSTVWMIVGPIFFSLLALAIYARYEYREKHAVVEKGKKKVILH